MGRLAIITPIILSYGVVFINGNPVHLWPVYFMIFVIEYRNGQNIFRENFN